MDWQDRLTEAAREAAKVEDPCARFALQQLIYVVDGVARETLPLAVDEETGLPR